MGVCPVPWCMACSLCSTQLLPKTMEALQVQGVGWERLGAYGRNQLLSWTWPGDAPIWCQGCGHAAHTINTSVLGLLWYSWKGLHCLLGPWWLDPESQEGLMRLVIFMRLVTYEACDLPLKKKCSKDCENLHAGNMIAACSCLWTHGAQRY